MAKSPGEPVLFVVENGEDVRRYDGWTNIKLVRDAIAAAGKLTLSSHLDRLAPYPIKPGNQVRLQLGDDVLLDGFVDGVEAVADKRGSTVQVSARDRTQDLVDCTSANAPGEFKLLRVRELAERLARPFAVSITDEARDGEQLPVFNLEASETAWSAIERACRRRGILAFSDGDGKLTLGRPGSRQSAIAIVQGPRSEGGNALRVSMRYTWRDRFRNYTVLGQRQGDDDGWGETSATIQGEATDDELPRFRPLTVLAEGQVTAQDAALRAQWEATVRAAQSANVEVLVPGWRESYLEGNVWRLLTSVDVRVPKLQLNRRMLVDRIVFERSRDQGTTTRLRLVREDAYEPKPEVRQAGNPLEGWLNGTGTETPRNA